jgi:5-methylthioadenosine/S-adenosylhomocysteine deaminase
MMRTELALVNCHTHLELGWLADLCPDEAGKPFTEWLFGLIQRRIQEQQNGGEAQMICQSIESSIETLLAAGVTHVGDISNSGLSLEPLLDSGLAGVVYLEVIGIGRDQALASFERVRRLLEKHRPYERNGMRIGISPHAPYSTHPDAFRAVADYSLREDVPVCIHLAESPFEFQALNEGTGPFIEMAARMGVDPPPIPRLSSVGYMESLGILETRPLLVHMVHVSDHDLDTVAAYGAKIAHCPRSNRLLLAGRMPLEKMLARNIPVALGTDSLASSPSLDVREEAETAVQMHRDVVRESDIFELLQAGNVLN